jgi:hypothetical protein
MDGAGSSGNDEGGSRDKGATSVLDCSHSEMKRKVCINSSLPDGIQAIGAEEAKLASMVKLIKEAVEAKDWYVGLRDGMRDLKRFQTLKHRISADVRVDLSVCLYGVVTQKDTIDQMLLKSVCQASASVPSTLFWANSAPQT